jgi:DNA integrity scanning protein DisA with diadenylate cyclase activity
MSWQRSSTVDRPPADPVGEAVGASIAEILGGASVELVYSPVDAPPPPAPDGPATVSAIGEGPPGWQITLTVRLRGRIAPLVPPASTALLEILSALPGAGLRAAARFSMVSGADATPLSPSLRRALRDTIVIEALSRHHACASDPPARTELIAETVEFLIELSGTRVESHDLTHGVIITDVLRDTPRLRFEYPGDLRAAKRAPLLFDGQRSLLVVDRQGRARTELQRDRLDRLTLGAARLDPYAAEFSHSGSLVAEATRRLGGIGFFLRGDRTIWVFADGQPLLMRRGEHWTAFPLELATAISSAIGASAATADIIVQAAFIISAQRHGAILAIVDNPDSLAGIVSSKDRYDLRDTVDPMAMQTETRLHHLIDAEDLDAPTLARFAALDGATILDRDGRLLAYGAIVTSSDSQHEGARTAAATTLSHTAEIVLKVSVDGDITVLRGGEVIATLLG